MPDLAAVRTVNGSPAPRASAGPVRAGTPAMRALLLLGAMLLLGGVLLLLSPVLVRADTGLTSAIANAYFLRTVDENLHSIAHQRAAGNPAPALQLRFKPELPAEPLRRHRHRQQLHVRRGDHQLVAVARVEHPAVGDGFHAHAEGGAAEQGVVKDRV